MSYKIPTNIKLTSLFALAMLVVGLVEGNEIALMGGVIIIVMLSIFIQVIDELYKLLNKE